MIFINLIMIFVIPFVYQICAAALFYPVCEFRTHNPANIQAWINRNYRQVEHLMYQRRVQKLHVQRFAPHSCFSLAILGS